MKMLARLTVVGMKFSKGTLDNGTAYDSTKVYCLTDMDASKGNALGQASAEYGLGDSTEYEKYKHIPFPFEADAEVELVTNGKTTRTVIVALKPIKTTAPLPAK